jgi:IPT/TIG domain
VTPNEGSSTGGTPVIISGENLSQAEVVSFGSKEVSFTITPTQSIEVTSPPGMGKVDITVKTPFGVSSTSEADVFSYKISTGRGGGGKTGGGNENKEAGTGNGGSGTVGGGTTPTPSGPSSETVVLGFGASHAPSCGASLLSKKISVQRNYRALFKLVGAGAGSCSGKLRLQVRMKVSKRHYRTRTIGSAGFSIAASKRVTIRIKLNGLGRALLASRHGRLGASLVIVRSKPSPTRAHTASVRLTRR